MKPSASAVRFPSSSAAVAGHPMSGGVFERDLTPQVVAATAPSPLVAPQVGIFSAAQLPQQSQEYFLSAMSASSSSNGRVLYDALAALGMRGQGVATTPSQHPSNMGLPSSTFLPGGPAAAGMSSVSAPAFGMPASVGQLNHQLVPNAAMGGSDPNLLLLTMVQQAVNEQQQQQLNQQGNIESLLLSMRQNLGVRPSFPEQQQLAAHHQAAPHQVLENAVSMSRRMDTTPTAGGQAPTAWASRTDADMLKILMGRAGLSTVPTDHATSSAWTNNQTSDAAGKRTQPDGITELADLYLNQVAAKRARYQQQQQQQQM